MVDIATVPSRWGPPIHGHQRQLWQEGAGGVTDIPVALEAHGLGTGSSELSEAILYTTTVRRRNGIVPVTQTLRSAIELSITYDFGIPAALWTPVLAASFTGCIKTFFLEYVCPEDSEFAHFIVLERGAMTPAIETSDLVMMDETAEVAGATTSVTVERRLWGWSLAYRIYYEAGGTIALNGVAFAGDYCQECDDSPGLTMVTVGGDGTAAGTSVDTDDRFTTNVVNAIGAALDVAYTVFADGDLRLVCAGDAAIQSAATAATTYRSIDGGANYIALTDIDINVYKFIRVGADILAIGVTVGGAAALELSTDEGGSFTALTSTVLPAAEGLISGAYDESNLKLYLGGDSGSLLAGRIGATGVNLVDITANLNLTTAISEVLVLQKDDIVVVGAGGVVEESRDGAATFSIIPFPTAVDITAAAGNRYRLVLGSATKVYSRSFLTQNRIKEYALEDGITLTGNITDIAINVDEDFNRFAVCTDAGEVAIGVPRYPNA